MIAVRWVAASLVWLASLEVEGQELPLNVFAVSPVEEIQDLVFLGEGRPALIRLRIRVDGEGHRGRWQEFARRLHAEADLNRDGVVDRVESTRAIDRVFSVRNPSAPEARVPTGRSILVPPAILTVEDMADQLASVVKPFQVERAPQQAASSDEETFRFLDRDRDGSLDLGELSQIVSSLARLDLDDDETLSAAELGSAPAANPNAPIVVNNRVATIAPPPTGSLVSASDLTPNDLASMILKRYSRAPRPPRPVGKAAPAESGVNLTLRLEEFPIDPRAFARLDLDGNGSINLVEMVRAIQGPADLEVIVRFGRREPGRAVLERLETLGGPPPFGAPGVRMVGDVMLIEVASTVVELASQLEEADPLEATRANLLTRFRAADLDGNGTLERDEVRRFLPLSAAFVQADRDGDGKLTALEWRAHLDLQAKVIGLRAVLQAAERGPSFLDLLDLDRDRRLGTRELRDAPARIALEDRDGDARVSLVEFTRHHRWTLIRGQPSTAARAPIVVDRRPGRPVGAPASAPPWFLKMDRNRDGDLSPREFLGTRSAFEGFDADRDGLISPPEATRRDRAAAP